MGGEESRRGGGGGGEPQSRCSTQCSTPCYRPGSGEQQQQPGGKHPQEGGMWGQAVRPVTVAPAAVPHPSGGAQAHAGHTPTQLTHPASQASRPALAHTANPAHDAT